MPNDLPRFELIVRLASQFTEAGGKDGSHPFDARNVHADLPPRTKELFDDGYYPQATFEAFKFVDEEMQRISGSSLIGKKLMMKALNIENPLVKLNPLMTETEKVEQEGFMFLFAGAVLAIRDPRAHKTGLIDDPDTCLDHLSLASMLLRRLDEAGLR
jgi:uncharacterized protein (TIGR02391 family)